MKEHVLESGWQMLEQDSLPCVIDTLVSRVSLPLATRGWGRCQSLGLDTTSIGLSPSSTPPGTEDLHWPGRPGWAIPQALARVLCSLLTCEHRDVVLPSYIYSSELGCMCVCVWRGPLEEKKGSLWITPFTSLQWEVSCKVSQ